MPDLPIWKPPAGRVLKLNRENFSIILIFSQADFVPREACGYQNRSFHAIDRRGTIQLTFSPVMIVAPFDPSELDQFNPAVVRFSFGTIVGVDRLGLSPAFCLQPTCVDAVSGDKIVAYGIGPVL